MHKQIPVIIIINLFIQDEINRYTLLLLYHY